MAVRGVVPIQVAVVHDHGQSALAEVVGQVVHDHDRPVPSPGAPHGDRQVRLALGHVPGKDDVEQAVKAFEELPVCGLSST